MEPQRHCLPLVLFPLRELTLELLRHEGRILQPICLSEGILEEQQPPSHGQDEIRGEYVNYF